MTDLGYLPQPSNTPAPKPAPPVGTQPTHWLARIIAAIVRFFSKG